MNEVILGEIILAHFLGSSSILGGFIKLTSRNPVYRIKILKDLNMVLCPRNWIQNGNKIISEMKISPKALAFWYLETGIHMPSKRTVYLCPRGFCIKDVEKLSYMLRNQFNLEIKRVSKGRLRLASKSYFEFMKLVRPFIKNLGRAFKIRTGIPGRSSWGAGKLDYGKAFEIRELYGSGRYKQIELAELYKVNKITINRILKGHTYKPMDMEIRGTADVIIKFAY